VGSRGAGNAGSGFLARAAALMAAPGATSSTADEPGGGATAPASLARVRAAVLSCLGAIAHDARARSALGGAVWGAAAAAAPYLSDAHPLNLREAAAKALAALARADADAVWLLLFDLAASGPEGPPPIAAAPEGAALLLEPPDGLPPLHALLPPPRPGQGGGGGGMHPGPAAVTAELAAATGRRAGMLLERLAAPTGPCAPGGAAWHALAAKQLEVLGDAPLC
jgi:hypothetical protein